MTTTPDEQPTTPGTGTQGDAEQAVLEAAQDVVDDAAQAELLPEAVPAMDALDHPLRLLLVHAHPDDETITNGATMAHYAARGAAVTLVTCTRGELGEVIPSELSHLEGDGDALAEHRTGELAAAMEALGVRDHRFLGSSSGVRYRDSGMVYDERGLAVAPSDMGADAFARAPVDEAAAHLVDVIREVRPQVVITYEPGGGYGHPDHVQAHRVATRAVELAATPGAGTGEPWTVRRVFWTVLPRSATVAALRDLAARGIPTVDPEGELPSMVVPDEQVTAVVHAPEQLAAKAAALRAHATQVVVDGDTFALSNGVHQPLVATEHYRLAGSSPGAHGTPAHELSDDLFAGLD